MTPEKKIGFRYACFISYRNPKHDVLVKFIRKFRDELGGCLELYLDPADFGVYLDEERLKGGDFFNKQLAESLCRSLCMVMIYTNPYFHEEKRYCAREYSAMESLEKKRVPLDENYGLIIPISVMGFEDVPDTIKKNRTCYDFSQCFLRGGKLNYGDRKKINDIARRIFEIYKEMDGQSSILCSECPSFEFPDETAPEVEKLLLACIPPVNSLPWRG